MASNMVKHQKLWIMMIKTFVKVWKSPFLYVILILDNESSKLWKSAGFTNDGPAKKGRNGYEKGPGQCRGGENVCAVSPSLCSSLLPISACLLLPRLIRVMAITASKHITTTTSTIGHKQITAKNVESIQEYTPVYTLCAL